MLFFFVILGRRGAYDTQHTPLALHNYDLTCTQTQMSWGGDLFEDIQTRAGGFDKCRSTVRVQPCQEGWGVLL